MADDRLAGCRHLEASATPTGGDLRARLEEYLAAAGFGEAGAIAQELATRFDTLAKLLATDPIVVADYIGVDAARAIAQVHSMMLHALRDEVDARSSLRNAEDAADFLRGLIGARPDEALVVLFLDTHYRLIDVEMVAEGRPDSVEFDHRRILLRAMGRGATGIIVAHNHPSGDARPSRDDIRMTRQLAELCKSMGIEMRDHLIVANREVRSAMFC